MFQPEGDPAALSPIPARQTLCLPLRRLNVKLGKRCRPAAVASCRANLNVVGGSTPGPEAFDLSLGFLNNELQVLENGSPFAHALRGPSGLTRVTRARARARSDRHCPGREET